MERKILSVLTEYPKAEVRQVANPAVGVEAFEISPFGQCNPSIVFVAISEAGIAIDFDEGDWLSAEVGEIVEVFLRGEW